jgi:hypothetical protein
MYHLGTFGYEDAFLRFQAVAKLCLGQGGKKFHTGMAE